MMSQSSINRVKSEPWVHCQNPAGLDFLLDSAYKPWLLEVNASPSLAWNMPDQIHTTEVMYSVKQQMLLDMLALLRLQDRFPAGHVKAAAAAEAARHQKYAKMHQPATNKHVPASAMLNSQLNSLLLQGASNAYFSSRPHLAAMVSRTAQKLANAVAQAPSRHDIEQAVQHQLQCIEQQQHVAAVQGAERFVDPHIAGLLRQHAADIVRVESELQTCGYWTSLLPHMFPSHAPADVTGTIGKSPCHAHMTDADVAVTIWLQATRPLSLGSDTV